MRNLCKRIMVTRGLFLFLFLGMLSQAFVMPFFTLGDLYAAEAGAGEIMPLADEIVWKYKHENGVFYKRQYNETKKVWIGSWIRC